MCAGKDKEKEKKERKCFFFFFKQKTAYEIYQCDWSSDVCSSDLDEMIEGTKIGKIIKGVRGEQPVNIDAVKSTIKSVAQMMVNHKEITECDLNPLIVTDNNELFAVDVRIKC